MGCSLGVAAALLLTRSSKYGIEFSNAMTAELAEGFKASPRVEKTVSTPHSAFAA